MFKIIMDFFVVVGFLSVAFVIVGTLAVVLATLTETIYRLKNKKQLRDAIKAETASTIKILNDSYRSRKPTNGDVIRQGGNEALIQYKRECKCDICAYAAPLDHAPACQRPNGKNCYDGILMWLNAPADAPDINDGTKESEGENE